MGPAPLERNAMTGTKSEIRNPKSETNPKFKRAEMFKTQQRAWFRTFRFQILNLFRISSFGFRISGPSRSLPLGNSAHLLLPCLVCLVLSCLPVKARPAAPADKTTVILVLGAAGQEEYGSNFLQQADCWRKACAQAECNFVELGREPIGTTNDLEQLRLALAAQSTDSAAQLWLVLIGHGTFDGKEARFNLRGPDLSATDLQEWLKPFRRPLAVLDTSSCSAPFLNKLSGTNRVLITATRSGAEQYFTRFGQFLAEAVLGQEADLDKDGQVSLLEAFLLASRRTAEFYKTEGRIATEHSLLDDNGDGRGTPPDWFRGVRAVKKPVDASTVDGALASRFCLILSPEERALTSEQRQRRDGLERDVAQWREQKGQLEEDAYYQRLEKLLVELAHCYDR
jgi:hypothetical protein